MTQKAKRNHTALKSFAWSFLLLLLSSATPLLSDVSFKTSKLLFQLGAGYNSNLYQVSSYYDSNLVQAPMQLIGAQMNSWLRFSRRLKTLIVLDGDYAFYTGESNANEWQVQAKAKTMTILLKKKRAFLPRVDWIVEFAADKKDQLYTDRAAGAENYITIKGVDGIGLNLGDYFDRQSFGAASGLDVDVTRRLQFSLNYALERNDYKDIQDRAHSLFYSLDNQSSALETAMTLKILSGLALEIKLDKESRNYSHKFAKRLEGTQTDSLMREYAYDKRALSLRYEYFPFFGRLSVSSWLRDDRFEGYYNYRREQYQADFGFQLDPKYVVIIKLRRAFKEYDNLDLGDKLLYNRYFSGELTLNCAISHSLAVTASFLFDREYSTFDKFNYEASIWQIGMHYRLR